MSISVLLKLHSPEQGHQSSTDTSTLPQALQQKAKKKKKKNSTSPEHSTWIIFPPALLPSGSADVAWLLLPTFREEEEEKESGVCVCVCAREGGAVSYLATQFYSGFYLPAPPSLYFPGGKGRQGNPTVLLFYFTGSWGSSLGWPGAFL